jgi:hypothetical protein
VTPDEVRQVLQGAPVFQREATDGPNPVYVAIGPTGRGRLLEVWGIYYESPPKTGWWRTITAMAARRRYEAIWNKQRGGMK